MQLYTIRLIVTLAFTILVAPLAAKAQPPGKVCRIGYISPGAGPGVLTETFRQGLRDLGYVEGQNLLIEYRWTESGDRLPALMRELVGLQPDLIVKRLELLKELIPSALRVAYLGNPEEPYSPVYLREVQRAAHVLGLQEVV